MGTKIEYVRGKVLEVTGGCTECSVGCENCWARKEVWRMAHNPLLGDKWKGLVKKTSEGLRWTGKIKLFYDTLETPLKRKKPTTYFVDSKADLFHPKVPEGYRIDVFDVIAQAAAMGHTILVLTKRIRQMAETVGDYCEGVAKMDGVHLGVTICNQKEADEMLPIALRIPGFDWVSAEPLLGPIDFQNVDWDGATGLCTLDNPPWQIRRIVVGGESGPKRRPCKLEHIRSIVQQCKAAGVGCYVKQIPINGKVEHDMSKFPKDLQVRDEI